jgi:hypothetical protein
VRDLRLLFVLVGRLSEGFIFVAPGGPALRRLFLNAFAGVLGGGQDKGGGGVGAAALGVGQDAGVGVGGDHDAGALAGGGRRALFGHHALLLPPGTSRRNRTQ